MNKYKCRIIIVPLLQMLYICDPISRRGSFRLPSASADRQQQLRHQLFHGVVAQLVRAQDS